MCIRDSKNCKSLKKAVVPDTVSSIGSSAFYGCEALTDITLGSKLKKIDSQTFYGCTALPSIVIPYNVTTIGDLSLIHICHSDRKCCDFKYESKLPPEKQ